MNKINLKVSLYLAILSFGILMTACQVNKNNDVDVAPQQPNIIYILADDLGYGEIGSYGQKKIETPHIDALREDGMKFTQHYSSAPVCAPARYCFLTGKHMGNAFIRGNHEWRERGKVWSYKEMIRDSTLEGQHPMPQDTRTIGHMLKDQGYVTSIFGKWGLGAPHTASIPTKMGFDRFYGYNCQRQAHTFYPVHLYDNEDRVYLNNDTIAPGTKLPQSADPYDTAAYNNYTLNDYTPDLIFDELQDFVNNHKDTSFFVYWATPIPHVPLQAPSQWVDYYLDKFGDEEPYTGDRGYFPHRYPRAAYAAMVSYLDENIGKLVQVLKEQDLYDNTLIVFTSDNGPSYAGGTDSPWFNSGGIFNSERGYGKGYVHEGGIRVPMIATWPKKIPADSKSDHISAHYDMMATLADITGYETSIPDDGLSMLPALINQDTQKVHEFLYWEFPEYGGQVAIRKGNWKLIRKNLKNDETPTLELYNLSEDPQELNNVAEGNSNILREFEQIFNREHTTPQVERFKIPFLERGLFHDQTM